MMIKEFLANKSSKERANIKAQEIVKLNHKGKFLKDELEIEIIDLKVIEGGIEALARAWKNGQQLGFGDGTVEIERFKIYNPPILVDDSNGDIVRRSVQKIPVSVSVDPGGWKEEIKTRRLREDPIEAIRLDLIHTIKLVGKEGTRIVQGKIGNTTSTFYPDANVESTSVDGYISVDPASPYVSWANLINTSLDADARTTVDDSGVDTGAFIIRKLENDATPWVNMHRGIYLFDTSPLGDGDTIDSATISIYQGTKATTGSGMSPVPSFGIVSSNPASNTALVKADRSTLGTTDFATRIGYASLADSAYNDWALNASGLANISKTGVSKFGLRFSADIDASEPTATGDTYYYGVFSFADTAGTTQDPKLVVVHAAVAATASPVMMMGLGV